MTTPADVAARIAPCPPAALTRPSAPTGPATVATAPAATLPGPQGNAQVAHRDVEPEPEPTPAAPLTGGEHAVHVDLQHVVVESGPAPAALPNDDVRHGANAGPAEPGAGLSLHDHAVALLEGLGIDTTETPTKGTGRRFVNALRELTYGLHVNPGRHLEHPIRHTPPDFITAPAVIATTGIPLAGVCTCHAFPFTGTADIAHLPKPGLSAYPPAQKLARFAQDHAARPTNAEHLAHVIAAGLDHHLRILGNAAGVAVRVTLTPLCLTLRATRTPTASTTATRITGALTDPAHHAELLTAWSTR